jgi:hypothetical protein
VANKRLKPGLRAALTAIKLRGFAGIDRRTVAAQSLLRWRGELIRDLGGIEGISAQRMALVELATRTRALLDHADAYLLAQPSIINRRRKALLPIVQQRQQLADSLARLLGQLGLERVPKPIKSLQEHIAEREREREKGDAA